MITRETFLQIMPNAAKRIDDFVIPLNDAMREFSINTPARCAAFLAQLAHESGEFRYMREIASGAAYEGRADLGNTEAGDGVRFKGRGPIQITGRANYLKYSRILYGDDRLLETPDLLEQPVDGCRVAGAFWVANGLNELADAGRFVSITRCINGGTNGLEDRQKYYARAQRVIMGVG